MSSDNFAYETDMMLIIDTTLGTTITNNNVFRLPVGEAVAAAFIQNGIFAERFATPSTTEPADTAKIWPDTNSNPTVYKFHNGSSWEVADWYDIWDLTGSLSGTEVNATATFDTDNVLIRSDGTSRDVQATGIVVSNDDDVSGIVDLTITGNFAVGGTVDGRDVAADGTKLDLITVTGAIDLDTFGSVTYATSGFAADNVVLRSDGTVRNMQASGLTIDDSDNLGGVANLSMSGDLTVTGTVNGRSIGDDGDTLDALDTNAVLVSSADASGFSFVLDEDGFDSNSATKLATQQSIKAYIDSSAVLITQGDASGFAFVVDEDDFASNSPTKLPTQQSVKAYVDALSADLIGVTFDTDDLSSAEFFLDEDSMASDDATKVASQQSIKAYVDNAVSNAGGGNVNATNDFGTTLQIIVSDGIVKNVKATGVTLDDSDNFTIPGATMTLGASAVYEFQHSLATQSIALHGGTAASDGASIYLYGGSHATLPGDFLLNDPDGDTIFSYDHSAETFNFSPAGTSAFNLTATEVSAVVDLTAEAALTVEGAFTSLGIDDDATAIAATLADTSLTLGQTGSAMSILRNVNAQSLHISGGNATTAGANILLYGGTNAAANDVVLASGSDSVYSWDDSADQHIWYAPAGTPVMTLDSGGPAVTISSALTATVTTGAEIHHVTSGTAAAGFGVSLNLFLENAAGGDHEAALISAQWVTPTDAAEDSLVELWAYESGAARRALGLDEEGNARVYGDTIAVGYDQAGDVDRSIDFWDNENSAWRSIRWNDANEEFEFEDNTGTFTSFSSLVNDTTFDASAITSGTFADARIAESNVTQYATAKGEIEGINTRTSSYTLALTDAGYLVRMNVASANNLTVPPNSSVAFETNTKIDVVQYGAGTTTIVAGSGVTIRSADSALDISGQYVTVTLIKIGTNEWLLVGSLA